MKVELERYFRTKAVIYVASLKRQADAANRDSLAFPPKCCSSEKIYQSKL
jgi:hypothetical protein